MITYSYIGRYHPVVKKADALATGDQDSLSTGKGPAIAAQCLFFCDLQLFAIAVGIG
jgi:hypothetical protein